MAGPRKLDASLYASFHGQLLQRQLTGRIGYQRPFLEDLSCEATGGGTIQWDPKANACPPFTAAFSQVIYNSSLLAVGDEEGLVSIIDTAAELPQALSSRAPRAQWPAHANAIFDVRWCQRDERMLTASGDKTVALWDTHTACALGHFKGHNGSVKAVCPSTSSPGIFATGGRDGALLVWDSRMPPDGAMQGERTYSALYSIQDAHKPADAKKTPRKRTANGKMVAAEAKHSVTAIVFLAEDTVLASAGATEPIVKLWDLRMMTQPAGFITPPPASSTDPLLATAAHPADTSASRGHGVTSLCLDHTGTRLLVSAANAVHYLYDAQRPHLPPSVQYGGHCINSFYVKAAFSGDGSHFVAGCTDTSAYIWQVDRPQDGALILEGHSAEVTGVAWCPSDFGRIATCGDDASVKVWALQRGGGGKKLSRKLSQVAASPASLRPGSATACSGASPLAAAWPQEKQHATVPAPSATPCRTPFAPLPRTANTPQGGGGAAPGTFLTTGKLAQRSIRDFFSPPCQPHAVASNRAGEVFRSIATEPLAPPAATAANDQGHVRSNGVIPEPQAAQGTDTKGQPQPAGGSSNTNIDPLQADEERRIASEAETRGRVQAAGSGGEGAARDADLSSCKRSRTHDPEASSRDHVRGWMPLSENSQTADLANTVPGAKHVKAGVLWGQEMVLALLLQP